MGMGIVSDEEFNKQINNSVTKPTTSLRSDKNKRPDSGNPNTTTIGTPTGISPGSGPKNGRGHNPEVPDALRKIIGDTAITDGPSAAVQLAKNFGISRASASAYSVGANSTSSYNERPNAHVVSGAKERIAKRARGKLMLALTHITAEKLQDAKPRDLAGIAKDMSAVAKNMEDSTPSTSSNPSGPTFNFYAPTFRKEETYDVVYTKE